jgi:NADH-quinone oxidoreductase subunit J
MDFKDIFFYLIAIYILGTGIMAVSTRKIFRASIWLLFSLIGIAAFYFWLNLEFLAAVQVAVYVGGIVVLIIFSIFLTQKTGNQMAKTGSQQTLFAALASLLGFALTAYLVYQHHFGSNQTQELDASIENIGTHMLNPGDGGFLLPFEAVSMLLLSALIGCIVIAMKIKKEETA